MHHLSTGTNFRNALNNNEKSTKLVNKNAFDVIASDRTGKGYQIHFSGQKYV